MKHKPVSPIRQTPAPISALLPLLIGIGTLLVHFKFYHIIEHWPETGRKLFFILGILQLTLGIWLFLWRKQDEHSLKKMYNRQRVRLPMVGFAYLTIMSIFFVGSLWGRNNMLMLVFSLMSGPFILNGWVTYSMLKRLSVTRTIPRRVMAGETISIGISLENGKHWLSSWLIAVRDWIENSLGDISTCGVVFARVPPKQQRHSTYQLRPLLRGLHKLGPMEFSTRFPIGLIERAVMVEETDELLVYPRIGKMTSRWKQQIPHMAEILDQREEKRGVYDDEFHRLREYRFGDNPKAIHWKTSARQQELMVREYQQSRDQQLILLIDLWKPEQATKLQQVRVELALSLAATISLEHLRENRSSQFQLLICGEKDYQWDCESASGTLEMLLDTFAICHAGAGFDKEEQLTKLNLSCAPNTRMIVISTKPRSASQFQSSSWFANAMQARENSNSSSQHQSQSQSLSSLLNRTQWITADWSEVASFFVLQ